MKRRSWEGTLCAVNAGIAIALAVKLGQHLASPAALGATDFVALRTGWWLALADPRRLYDVASQASVERAIQLGFGSSGFVGGLLAYLHPPHLALAGSGFEWLAERWNGPAGFYLWTAGNLALAVQLVRLLRAELGASPRETFFVAVMLAGFFPLFDTLRQGQLSLLLAVSILGFINAVRGRRPLAAAAYLLIMSCKPQILPAPLIVLLWRRERRVLAAAIALGLGAALLTAAVLGPRVWIDYATHVRALDRLFGGSPARMPALHGLLARLLPAGRQTAVETFALVGWLVALATVAGVVARRRRLEQDDLRVDFAFAFAAGFLTSPHFYPHDLLLWIAPVVLILAVSRAEPARWRHRVRLVLAWPIWLVIAQVADGDGARLPVDLALVPLIIVSVWTARAAVGRAPVFSDRLPPA